MSFIDGTPHTARPFGCECGAGLHEGETHEAALACEMVEASSRCDCGGFDPGSGEVVHDGFCPLAPWPGPCTCLAGCLPFDGCRLP